MFRLNTNVDSPPSEDKSSAGRPRLLTIAKLLKSVAQDIIFFFVLSCIAILLIFAILMALEDLAKFQAFHNSARALPVKIAVTKSLPECAWPKEWCRFFADFSNRVNQAELF